MRRQVVGTVLREPGEPVVAHGVGEDPAALHEEHAVGQGERPPGALLGENGRRAELADEGEEALGRLGIELRRRLVEEQEPRAKRKR